MCRYQANRSGLIAIATGAALCALAVREPNDTCGPQLARLASRSLITAVGGTIGMSIDHVAIAQANDVMGAE